MNTPTIDRHFLLRKLHSLTGIIPIGAYLCFHLFENSLAAHGPDYFYQNVILKIDALPYLEVLEIFVIALPILFHGIYGMVIWWQGKSNLNHYGYFRNWMYWIQRFSGAIAFLFIISHVWGTRIQILLANTTKAELFNSLAAQLANTPVLIWYIVGILACIIHFSNGIWLALITWGVTIGRRSQRLASYACAAIGLILLLLSAEALRGFLTTVS